MQFRFLIVILFTLCFNHSVKAQFTYTIILNTDAIHGALEGANILIEYLDLLNLKQMNRLMNRTRRLTMHLDEIEKVHYDLYDSLEQSVALLANQLSNDMAPILASELVASIDTDPSSGSNSFGTSRGENYNPVPQSGHQKTFNRLNSLKYILNTAAQYQEKLDSIESREHDEDQADEREYVENEGVEGGGELEQAYQNITAIKAFADSYASSQMPSWCFIQTRMFDAYKSAAIRDSLRMRSIGGTTTPAAGAAAQLASDNDPEAIQMVQTVNGAMNSTNE